jgi:hypothetical protein
MLAKTNIDIRSVKSTPRRFEHSSRWGATYPKNVVFPPSLKNSNGKTRKGYTKPPRGKPERRVSGQYLAKNHLDARGRAQLAADVIEGKVTVERLTAKQIAIICRTNIPYITEARKTPATDATRAASEFASATPEAIARQLGPSKLWELLEFATT